MDAHFLFAGQAGPLNEAVGPPDSHHGWPLASSFPPYVAMPMLVLAVVDDHPWACHGYLFSHPIRPLLRLFVCTCLVPAWVYPHSGGATSLHQCDIVAPSYTHCYQADRLKYEVGVYEFVVIVAEEGFW